MAKEIKQMVLPSVQEQDSKMNKKVTASMFINNKYLNVENILAEVENNPIVVETKYETDDPSIKKHGMFKRYYIPENTIIMEKTGEIKYINAKPKKIEIPTINIEELDLYKIKPTDNTTTPDIKVDIVEEIKPEIDTTPNKNYNDQQLQDFEFKFDEQPEPLIISKNDSEPTLTVVDNNFASINEPIKVIEKNMYVSDNIHDIYKIIDGDLKEKKAEEIKIDESLINHTNNLQPSQEDNVPQKTYKRLSEQEYGDKIHTYFQPSSLPQMGEVIYYPDVDYAIEMIDIYKWFNNGKIKANNGITLRVRKNDVHAIIGENGAGKSVLMSILFGIYDADSGIVKVNGEEVVFSSAKDATVKGIGMVHQHFKLIETNTIYQNVIMGLENVTKGGFIRHEEAKRKINELNKKYGFNLDINKKISSLNVAEQQKTEILKLLYRDADILILDEPTAVLSEFEIKQLLKIIKQLKDEGKTIILITHKFNEIKEVADRATVIRLGTYISEFDVKTKNYNEMVTEMVGNNVNFVANENKGQFNDKVLFEIKDLVLDPKISTNPINFKINSGEIFAIAGVTGNGQSELALTIAGLMKNKSGKILINNNNINKKSVKERYNLGLAYVPEDRHKYAVILDMPIYVNTVIDKIDDEPFSKNGFIRNTYIKEYARNFIKKNDVRGTSRGTTPIRNLSGGNQQKLVIGRELDRNYDVIILEQPTRGLDIAAINKIHQEILNEKAKGKAVLLISYELDEILSLADTVAVMNKNQIVNISNINDTNREKIGDLMVGENV